MSATIKDVAKLANTSTATVSKVINGSYSISQATIDIVNSAMQELNYHPNTRARNFAKQCTNLVYFLAKLERNSGFDNPHMFEILAGLEHVLSAKGYQLIVKSLNEKEACDFVKRIAAEKSADGLVIHGSIISKELDERIEQEKIPHIVIGNPNFNSHFCWIDVDNHLAGEMAVKGLLEAGYQTLAFLGGKEEDKISENRLDGVLSVLQLHDIILPKGYMKSGDSDWESGYDMTLSLLDASLEKRGKRPEAIICANNNIAYGCMSALNDRGVLVPEEMGVITFDDYPFSRILKPKLTVVNIDVYDLGSQAGKWIVSKIKKPNLHIQSYITLPSLIKRESIKEK